MLYLKVIACTSVLVCLVRGNRIDSTEVSHYETLPDLVAEESRHHEAGGGIRYHADHYSEAGSKGDDGNKSNHQYDEEDYGRKNNDFDKSTHGEQGDNKKSHYDKANHSADYQQDGKQMKAAKFGEKKGHKRGHKTKGYHNKFHKDEYHKEHKFYDNYHKSGSFNKDGNYRSRFGSKSGGHKRGRNEKSARDDRKYGKHGHHDRGKFIDEVEGHDRRQGDDSHHSRHENYGKAQSSANGRGYKFQRGLH